MVNFLQFKIRLKYGKIKKAEARVNPKHGSEISYSMMPNGVSCLETLQSESGQEVSQCSQ